MVFLMHTVAAATVALLVAFNPWWHWASRPHPVKSADTMTATGGRAA